MRRSLLLLPAAFISLVTLACPSDQDLKDLEARVTKHENQVVGPRIDSLFFAVCDLDKHVTGLDPSKRACVPGGSGGGPEITPIPKYPPN